MLRQWSINFTLIHLIEDQWFRRHDGYDVEAWGEANRLPWGFAVVGSLLIAYYAGGVRGMNQTWYTGPIGQHFGPSGGDVGVFLSGAFTLIIYPIFRTIEKRVPGK